MKRNQLLAVLLLAASMAFGVSQSFSSIASVDCPECKKECPECEPK